MAEPYGKRPYWSTFLSLTAAEACRLSRQKREERVAADERLIVDTIENGLKASFRGQPMQFEIENKLLGDCLEHLVFVLVTVAIHFEDYGWLVAVKERKASWIKRLLRGVDSRVVILEVGALPPESAGERQASEHVSPSTV
jgi:hypothetical protein